MKYLLKLVLVIALFKLMISLLPSVHALDVESFKNEKKLLLGTDAWPPYHFEGENNQITGFATVVIIAVLRNMDKPLEILVNTFTETLKKVENGEVHGSFLASKGKKRMQYAHFPEEPVINSNWVFLVREPVFNTIKLTDYSDLFGRKVGVVKGYVYTESFWIGLKKHDVETVESETDEMNYQKLYMGRIDFVPGEIENSHWYLNNNNLQDSIRLLPGFVISENPLFVMWSKKATPIEFVKAFSEALKAFKKSDEYQKIRSQFLKYSG